MLGDPGDLILVADVGGTHLNLGLLSPEGSRFRLLRKARSFTREASSLLGPILHFLAEDPLHQPTRACFAGAGPVIDWRLHLTNASWDVDAKALERALGLPVKLVNDSTALSCGVLHLDLADSQQVTQLPHGNGSFPLPDPQGLALVVGAGTGLGVGFVLPTIQGPRPFPSEGGHMGLPVYDEASLALWEYLQQEYPGPPGAELAVSGPGIARLFRFLLSTHRAPSSETTAAILALSSAAQPAAIAAAASSDPACQGTLDLFLELYARICADLCAAFMPSGGLFLAGGIPSKNESQFLKQDRFMARFERNYLPHLDDLARRTPVILVRDYDLSLFGAAYALACPEPGT